MKRIIILFFAWLLTTSAFCQGPNFIATRNNSGAGQDSLYNWFITNSPTSAYGSSVVVLEAKQSDYIRFLFKRMRMDSLNYRHNDGVPVFMLHVDSFGNVKSSPVSVLGSMFATSSQLAQKVSYSDTGAMLSAYLRKVDTTGKFQPRGNYLVPSDTSGKWQPKGSYLVSFVESDPRWLADSNMYYRKGVVLGMLSDKLNTVDTTGRWQPKGNYLTSFTEVDPRWISDSTLFARKAQLVLKLSYADTAAMLSPYLRAKDTALKWQPRGSYLTSYTEADPTVNAAAKGITSADTARWNGAARAAAVSPADTAKWNSAARAQVLQYNRSGAISPQLRVFTDTITPTTGNGFSINISTAGFTRVTSVQVQAESNTTSAASVPLVAIRSYSTSAVVVNIVQSNSTLISLLGINVLGLQFLQSVSGVRLHVTVFGY